MCGWLGPAFFFLYSFLYLAHLHPVDAVGLGRPRFEAYRLRFTYQIQQAFFSMHTNTVYEGRILNCGMVFGVGACRCCRSVMRVSWKIGADAQLVVGLDGSDVLKMNGVKYSWVTLLENG